MAGDEKLTNDLNLVPRPNKTGAVFSPPYIFMTWCLRKHRYSCTCSFKLWINPGASLEDNDCRLFNSLVSPFGIVNPT
jgi:hypothetical protein